MIRILTKIIPSESSRLSPSRGSQVLSVREAGAEGERDSELRNQRRETRPSVQVEENQSHFGGLLLSHAQ